MGEKFWPQVATGAAITQSEVQQAVEDALIANEQAPFDQRYHDSAAVGINDNAGAWVNLGGAGALAQAARSIEGTSTIGEPLELGYGPNAGAVTKFYDLNRGDGPFDAQVAIPSGNQLWVRSLSALPVSVGELTLNLLG